MLNVMAFILVLHKPLSSQEIFSLVVVFADKGTDFESTELSERQKQDAIMEQRYCQPLHTTKMRPLSSSSCLSLCMKVFTAV